MTFEEYKIESKRTSACDSLEHAALGICGELTECAMVAHDKEKLLDEIGDVTWYLAMMARCLDTHPVYSTPKEGHLLVDMLMASCELAGDVKSSVFNKRDKNINASFNKLYSLVIKALDGAGLTAQEVLDHNIEKLRKRYPEGYSHKDCAEKKDEQ